MRLSNKSTFSLVCFIFLLAFVALPVMAHGPDATDVGPHTHPVTEAVAANNQADPPVLEVPIHNAHPVVTSIVLKGDNTRGTMAAVITDDDVNENQFTLVVTFDRDIVGTAATTVVPDFVAGTRTDGAALEGADLTTTILQVDNTPAYIATSDFVINRVMGNDAQYEIVVTPGTVPNADTADTATNDDTLTYRIQVNANVVFSLRTTEIVETSVTPVTVDGGGNLASDVYVFTLVSELPPAPTPPDTTKPSFTVAMSPANMSELEAGSTVQFTLTASEALGTGNNELLATDVVGTTNVASQSFVKVTNTQYVVIVTPTDLTQPIVLTIPADSVFDTADTPNGNAEQVITFTPEDTEAPTVTIESALVETGADAGKIRFTFTFSEAVQGFDEDDLIRGSGVTLAGNLVPNDDNTVFTVLVNPAPAGSPTSLTLRAGAVKDGANELVGDQLHTYVPVVPPDPPGPDPTNPTTPANIFSFSVPANSFVILVRNANALVGGSPPTSLKSRFAGIVDINNARVISDAKIIEWSAMPDLAELFDRGAPGGGGALVLRKSVGDTAAPAVGTVGISEIMWAMDAGYIGQTKARDTQWIEIENLNATAKTVLIYAQTGAQITDSNKVVTKTQADDTIHGNPSGMVVDVMTNYFNGSSRGSAGWDVVGSNGSSKTGIDFVSMARKGTFDLASKDGDQYNKRYVKTAGSTKSSDGRSSGSWEASTVRYDRDTTDKPASVTTAVPATFDYLGTPGRANTFSVSTHLTTAGRTNLNDTPPVLFNEIGNRSDSDKAYEWIEIRNTTGSPVSLKSYRITTITAVDTENVLYTFPHDKAADVPANGVLLLLASDPADDTDHPIAVGYNVDKVPEDQPLGSIGDHIPRYKVTPFAGNGIPNGNFVLVLRRPDTVENKNEGGKGPSETGNNDLDKIVDIAGHHSNLSKANYPNAVSSTSFWPLHNFPAPQFGNNNLTENKVHYRRNVKSNKDDRLGTGAWDNDNGKSAYTTVGYTGIGYKRWVPRDNNRYGGDPGYHSPLVNLTTDVADDVTISEIMLSTGDNGRLPQWIELTNNSKTKTINLKSEGGWRLVIETPGDAIRTLNFKDWDNGNYIYPNQTVLIVAGSVGRGAQAGSDLLRSSIVFKADRVFNVLREYASNFSEIEVDGEMVKNDRYRFIHPQAFNIKLIDGKNNVADEIGNLDGRGRTNDTPAWEYPDGLTKDGYRTSFIRVYDEGVARAAVGSDAVDVLPVNTGDTRLELNDTDSVIPDEYAWIRAEVLNFDSIYVRHTWYGSESDFGTPGVRKGQPLPVSLSFFRPTLEDGKVVIRWTTESELDNAGFNILRSESRNGEFTKVNNQLIQGNGTTAERSTYKWVDTSAKPGAVYYYQIEDVSFAGEHNTLTTTKLKGLISAQNKLTTQWGELKEVQ